MLKEQLQQELVRLKALGKLRHRKEFKGGVAGRVTVNERSCLDFANWDIYNLQKAVRSDRGLHRLIENEGLHARAPRALAGTHELQKRFESRVASFFGAEAALEFTSRNQAVLSYISGVGRSGDVFLYDQEMQAPIADAAYLVEAQSQAFCADKAESLCEALAACKMFDRIFVCFESVSEKYGTLRPLAQLLDAAEKAGAELFIDESVAIGTLGIRGAGALEHFQLHVSSLTILADFAYAAAGSACLLVGCGELIDYLFSFSATFLKEHPRPPFLAAVNITLLDKLELQLGEREKIRLKAEFLSAELKQLGYTAVQDLALPYVTVAVDDAMKVNELRAVLLSKGIVVSGFYDGSTLRFLINAAHSEEEVRLLLSVLSSYG